MIGPLLMSLLEPFALRVSGCFCVLGDMPVSESKTSVRRLEAIERQRQALEMRKAGHSYPAIATALEYASTSGALKAVTSALTRTLQEPADEVRQLELTRLDAMLAAIWGRVEDGELPAFDRAQDIMKRRAALLGLDMPTKVENSGAQTVTVLYGNRDQK